MMKTRVMARRRTRTADTADASGGTMMQTGITRAMTWASMGLGVAQLAMPGQVAKLVGVGDTADARLMMRLLGLREMAVGAGLLSGWRPRSVLGGRVGGDLADLALLGSALGRRRAKQGRILGALGATLGITALDLFGVMQPSRDGATAYSPTSPNRLTPTTKSIVVNRTPAEVYQFWLNFEQFPRFMKHIESVQKTGDNRWHWKARGPGGVYEWDAEMVENRPNELITWRSLPGADVVNEGSVRFERAPGGRGTLVRVNLRYSPPAGAVGSMAATLFGSEPGQQLHSDLRRFKQVIETGEVVRSDASIHDSPHNARPPEQRVKLQHGVQSPPPARSAAEVDAPEPRRTAASQNRAERASSDAEQATSARGGAQ